MNKYEKNIYKNLFEYPTKIIAELELKNEKLEQENQQLKKQKDDVVELIKRQDKIRNYYEYEECGYDEYNYDDDFKEELLRMLGEIDE